MSGRAAAFGPGRRERLREAVGRFPRLRVLVLGDAMLDVFIWGEVARISPEAPVPVVDVHEETRRLGGAANVVHNVAALGAKVCLAACVGDDAAGGELAGLLETLGASREGLIVEPGRPTTTKTRIIARNQQVVRFDSERRGGLLPGTRERLLAFVRGALPEADAVIVSDYAKGVVSGELLSGVIAGAAPRGVPVAVDPKIRNARLYRGATLITPNHHEAAELSGVAIDGEESLAEAGARLLSELSLALVLVTRGKDGMSLFERGRPPVHIETVAQRVFDVTGAGDTVIAAMTLGLASGLSPEEAAVLANLAAGFVVGEVGTAAVGARDLLALIETGEGP